MSLRSGVLFFLLAMFSVSSPADEVLKYAYQDDSTEIALFNKPCAQKDVAEFVKASMPEMADRFKMAVGNFKLRSGEWKLYEGCWIEYSAEETGQPAIGMLWEDGDRFLVPKEIFKDKPKGTGV